MKHEFEDPKTYNTTYTKEGEKVKLIRRWCKVCGHSMNFVSRKPMICRHCGNFVYPDDRYEFEVKLKKELNKR